MIRFKRLSQIVHIIAPIAVLSSTMGAGPASPKKSLTIAIVGDSTVSDYATDNPLRGWGQMLPKFFKPEVKIANFAVPGKSTKTFRDTGNWSKVIALKPDFVLIQFGHNDSHPSNKPEATAANGEYMTNLTAYIAEAKAASITPILVTPMHRRIFDASGKPTKELERYAAAMKQVGKETNTSVIDLYFLSGDFLEKLGEAGSDGITSQQDRTHFTEKGAMEMATLIASECPKVDPRLAGVMISSSRPGSGFH